MILDHTRHIPRDLVQVLRKIQQYGGGEPTLAPRQVKSGLRLYSTDYFLPELRNEISGYLDGDDIDKALMLLTSMQRPRVTYAELERAAHELDLGRLDLKSLIRALFDASCIGTVSEAPGRRPLYTFKYRNPTATILPGQVDAPPPRGAQGAEHRTASRTLERRRPEGAKAPAGAHAAREPGLTG